VLWDLIGQGELHGQTCEVGPKTSSICKMVATCNEETNSLCKLATQLLSLPVSHRHRHKKNLETLNIIVYPYQPPPSNSVGIPHCKIKVAHIPTPLRVRENDPSGSPLSMSAPHCSTTTSGSKRPLISERTLEKKTKKQLVPNTNQVHIPTPTAVTNSPTAANK